MLNAYAIYRLLIEGEPPPPEASLPPEFPDDEDPSAALDRYTSQPPVLRGSPVHLYDKWKAKLNGRRTKRFPSIKSTMLVDYPEDNAIGLRYHDTDVIWVDSGNNVVVDTKGYRSRTTLARINDVSPGGWGLYGRKPRGDDHLSWNFFWYHPSVNGQWSGVFPFTDGDVIKADGMLYLQAQPVYGKKPR